MTKENPHKAQDSNMELQVTQTETGVDVSFVSSDGVFSNLEEDQARYEEKIDKKTKKIRQLQALMTAAAGLQVYQIYEGITDEDPAVIWPIIFVAAFMVYVRNEGISPLKAQRSIDKQKLELLNNFENPNPDDEIDDIESDEIYPIFPSS